MADDPLVSVIIPTYNRERYLGEATQSVFDQTFTSFELLIVDDGSDDGTPALVQRSADPRVHYIRQPHQGVSAAMNAGMRAARGALVARLDSDDRWATDLLSTLVAILDRRAELGFVYAKAATMDGDGRPLAVARGGAPRFAGDGLRSLLYDDCTCNIALVARRSCLEEAGPYDEALAANEDWDMWLRVARRHPFAFVDRLLASVRLHDDSLTDPTSPRFTAVLDTRTVPLDKLFADDTLPAAARAMRPEAYANVYLWKGLRRLQVGHYRQAAREFRLALRTTARPAVMALRVAWRGGAVPALRRSRFGQGALTAPLRLRQALNRRTASDREDRGGTG